MSINKTITLSWDGIDTPIIITMAVIDRLEEDLNLIKIANSANSGDIKYSQIAKLISCLFKVAGRNISQEDVWMGMFAGDNSRETLAQAVAMVGAIMEVIFPMPKKPKQDSQLKTSKAKSGKGKGSLGKSSTK